MIDIDGYLKLLDSGIEANGCLLQHANILFNFGIYAIQ